MTDSAEATARETGRQVRRAADSRWFEMTARGGFVGSGVVHLLIGYLVILLGIGSAAGQSGGQGSQSGETDQSGALAQLAAVPGGVVLLWVVAVGTAALTIRLVVEAVVGGRTDTARSWLNRAKNAGKAIVYGVIAYSSASFALGAGKSSSGSTRGAAATALATPGGVFLLLAAAAVAIAIGIGLVVIGVRRSYRKQLVTPPKTVERPLTVLAVTGYVAKGIAVTIVGVLVAVAAFRSDPQQASGLDAAFDAVKGVPGGGVLLVVIGIGFLAFGAYSFLRAKYARI
ncbi:hypothetical protein ASG04_10815 [Curtobacterium sp. Leaf183]|uniref:DUF1206 domain-containing protein n=1 Tax=Curtobacterium sp. Leaf183 TaxID=1736291 RepID=UPI0006FBFAF4|nr:DUF1206 domain-containing protein [Curtobacterium sp. Leaf183]KQS09335.1 hypothetical protein ASG04_10815 [Curtobacterium sp. Leaf183]